MSYFTISPGAYSNRFAWLVPTALGYLTYLIMAFILSYERYNSFAGDHTVVFLLTKKLVVVFQAIFGGSVIQCSVEVRRDTAICSLRV